MEKQTGYYLEKYVQPEIKRNLQAGVEVVASIAGAFRPVTDLAEQILIREASQALRFIASKR